MGRLVETHGKLLLLGEHSAVYGHPAIGRVLPWTLRIEGESSPEWHIVGAEGAEPLVRAVVACLVDLAKEAGWPEPPPARLLMTSDIPPGSGLGSSAALCAGLVNLFWPSLPLERRDWLAWRAEALFHGTPSGIDTALALRSGWWQLDASQRPARALPLSNWDLPLCVGAVPRESDTKSLIAGIAMNQGADDRARTAAELGQLAATTIQFWAAEPLDRLATRLCRARELLARWGLETQTLRDVLEQALRLPGALAAKLSGAGGGGAFFVLFRSWDEATDGTERLERLMPLSLWTMRPRLVRP